jgi:tetratricopeptide (TPR) repeat protein
MRKSFLILLGLCLSVYGCTNSDRTNNPLNSLSGAGPETAIYLYQTGFDLLKSSNYDSAAFYGNKALPLADEVDDPVFKGRVYMLLADANHFQSNYDEAFRDANSALEIGERFGSDSLTGFAYERIGNVYRMKGEYELASENLYKAINIAEKNDLKLLLAYGYEDLGNVFDHDDDIESAREYYLKAKTIYEELGDIGNTAGIIGNLGTLLSAEGKYREALAMQLEVLEMLKQVNHYRYMANTYHKISVCYRELNQLDSARFYVHKTIEMDRKNGYKRGIAQDYEMLGELFLRTQDYDSAKIYLQKGIDLAKEIGVINRQSQMYKRMFRADTALGNYKGAARWLELSQVMTDSVYNLEKLESMAEMREKYEAEKREQQIAALETQNKLKGTRNAALGFSFLLILGIVSLLWVRQRTQQQQEIKMLEKDKIITEQELEASILESEYLKKELTNYALHISQKNDFLDQIKSEMAEVKSKINNNDAIKHINQMGSKIYQNTAVSKETEEFQAHVEQVCEGFFKRLDDKFPDLTEQEKRLAALVRLNLSSKDIANIFNISPKSVDQGRYRLRKKLDLDSQTNLTQYLNVV